MHLVLLCTYEYKSYTHVFYDLLLYGREKGKKKWGGEETQAAAWCTGADGQANAIVLPPG